MINRREFLELLLLTSGYTLLGSRLSLASPIQDIEVSEVDLNITYVTEILKPPKRSNVDIWIPVPQTDQEQEITGLKVESPLPYRFTTEPVWKNRMIYINTERLNPGDRILMHYRIKRKATGVIVDRQRDPSRYLEPSEWEKWDEKISAFVDKLTAGDDNPVEIARKVYNALIERLRYIHEVCGRGVSTITFEEKVGRCDEYHALFRSMMMYRKIPVSWEQGMALPYPSELKKEGQFEADCINAHSWVRFYIGDGRWFPVDVSEADRRPALKEFYFGRLLPDRIKLSNGRGFTLSPPQKGIINTFAYTYIEAGGIPAIYGHNYRNRIHYKLINMRREKQ